MGNAFATAVVDGFGYAAGATLWLVIILLLAGGVVWWLTVKLK